MKAIPVTTAAQPAAAGCRGMSVTEMMVALTIVGILAAVAIPSYMKYTQQVALVSSVIPDLHLVESEIAISFSMNQRLPTDNEFDRLLLDFSSTYLDVALNGGILSAVFRAPSGRPFLASLDGASLTGVPIIAGGKITGWTLTGELAERIGGE